VISPERIEKKKTRARRKTLYYSCQHKINKHAQSRTKTRTTIEMVDQRPQRNRKRVGQILIATCASAVGYFFAKRLKQFFDQTSEYIFINNNNRAQFLFVGDSLTQRGFDSQKGWVTQFASVYQRKADCVNRGYSGYNSKWVLDLIKKNPGLFLLNTNDNGKVKPALVVVFLGANDAAVNHKKEYAVALNDYSENLKTILDMYKGIPRIVITPPPIIEKDRVKHALETMNVKTPDRLYQHTEKYAVAAEKVARELGVGLADAFDKFEKYGAKMDELFSDGLHFSVLGESLLFQVVSDAIKQTYPWLIPEKMRLDAPLHGELAALMKNL
jgi:isoamyl acetate esterase